jgi:hypothetical protein
MTVNECVLSFVYNKIIDGLVAKESFLEICSNA